MTDPIAALVTHLRRGLDDPGSEPASQELFEHWLSRETWQPDSEAVPLLVGVAPSQWPTYLARHDLGEESAQLCARLCSDLACDDDQTLAVMRVCAWARESGITLPPTFQRVLEFIIQVLPSTMSPQSADDAATAASERELVLGAALALVTRFPQQCLDAHGFYDGARIADLMLTQAARWFPLQPPRLSQDDIVRLLEKYLS